MGKGSCSSSVEFSWHAEDAVQFTGHVFTFRPLPTKDAKLHKQNCKSPKAKTVQPQEVNSSFNFLFCFFFVLFYFVFFETGFLCNSPICPGTCYVDKAGLELTEIYLLLLPECLG